MSVKAGELAADQVHDSAPRAPAVLSWVGMERIEMPVRIAGPDGVERVPARIDLGVDLCDPGARGIHMSRLYLLLDRHLGEEPLSPCALRRLLADCVQSQDGLSRRAGVRVAFEHLVRRPALISDLSGWRGYPVVVSASFDNGRHVLEVEFRVLYSSTCPCSAALARDAIREAFVRRFPAQAPLAHDEVVAWLASAEGIVATPHSQRSSATIRVRLDDGLRELPITAWIDLAERTLATPVQTAVKRADEQAFALLNGGHAMFCEDAARRLRAALDVEPRIADFHVHVAHHESLHPHDAAAVATKGVVGGFRGEKLASQP